MTTDAKPKQKAKTSRMAKKAPARLAGERKAEGAALTTSGQDCVAQGQNDPTLDHLTFKQRLFVEAYVGRARGNGTEAARLAGYEGDDNTLKSVGSENLRKPDVAKEIQVRRKELVASISAETLILSAAEDASSSYEDFVTVNEDGSFAFDLVKAKAAGKLHLIEDLGHDKETGAPVIKLPKRGPAREFLAKMLGFTKGEVAGSTHNTQVNIYKDLDKLSTEELRKIREVKQLGEGKE